MKEDAPALLGPGRHHLTMAELRATLVDDFEEDSRLYRFPLYVALYTLYQRLKRCHVSCELWVDGSFLTTKLQPEDIDLSIMVQSDVYDSLPPDGKALLDHISFAEGRYLCHLDVFVCIVYPKGTEMRELDPPEEWASQWSLEHNERYLKGFVVVRIEN